MAVEREVLRDITKYQSQLIGPFSARQCVCILIGGAIAIPVYLGLSKYLIQDAATLIAVACCMPVLVAGFWPGGGPYGIPLEKFLWQTLQLIVLAPYYRKYATTNEFSKEMMEVIETENTDIVLEEYNEGIKAHE